MSDKIDSKHEEQLEESVIKPTAPIDTVHNDEGVKVLANYTGEVEWTEAEERKLRRRIDWKLMPPLCMTYLLQYYDKAMLSQAVSNDSRISIIHIY